MMRCNSASSLLTFVNQLRRTNQRSNLNKQVRGFHKCHDNQFTWSILLHLRDKLFKSANKKYACLLLNFTNQESYEYFEKYRHIWDEANLKIAVDGSANSLAMKRCLHTADIICGDFDSIDAQLLEQLRCPTKASRIYFPKNYRGPLTSQYSSSSIKMPQVIDTPSQKETDFTKAIRVAASVKPELQYYFGVYYSDGSRIDHLLSLINSLHVLRKNIILINAQSNTISWLLMPGKHTISKHKGQELCSLVPFMGPTEVKTQGLVYNITPTTPLCFGNMISTSNICSDTSDSIFVETNRELLWCIDVFV